MTLHRRLALLSAGLIYVLIVLGGWIRANNAGLSCPDWPTCYGHWVLTPSEFASLGDVGYTYYQMMLEWLHRLIAGVILGPLLLVLTLLAWLRRRSDPAGLRIALVMLLLLLVQAGLGGVTVLDQNSPWSVALHLGTALLLFSSVILIAARASAMAAEPVPRVMLPLAATVWVLAIIAMTTAAMTAKSGASLACWDWPSCDGSYLPALDDPQVRIHFIHRSAAALTGLGILTTLVAALVSGAGRLLRLAGAACLLVAVQIGLGALVILLEMPQWSQAAHQATGVLLFALLSWIFAGCLLARPHEEPNHASLSHA